MKAHYEHNGTEALRVPLLVAHHVTQLHNTDTVKPVTVLPHASDDVETVSKVAEPPFPHPPLTPIPQLL